jgi:hypothetical protein
MIIGEKVTVGMVNNVPKYVIWHGRSHTVIKIGFHHVYREGRTLYHIFSVIADTIFMRLKFDTDTLGWVLENIGDSLLT